MKTKITKAIPSISYQEFVEKCESRIKQLKKEGWNVIHEERPNYTNTNYLVFYVKYHVEDKSNVIAGYYYLDFATNEVLESIHPISEYMDMIKLTLEVQSSN